MQNNENATALFNAVATGERERVQQLLNDGAMIDERYDGSTPLMAAAGFDFPDILADLLGAGADVGALTESGDSALHWAARGDSPAGIAALIKSGAQINLQNKSGDTPLYAAVSYSYLASARALVRAGANVNVANNEGNTPAHIAAQKGDMTILFLLMGADADIQRANKKGQKPLHEAQRYGHNEVQDALIRTDISKMAQSPEGESVGTRVYRNAVFSVVEIQDKYGRSLGSGVVVMPGIIATNCHVIRDGQIWVSLAGVVRHAQIRDYVAGLDFCLLAVSDFPSYVAKIRPYLSLSTGEDVYAIGHPEGEKHSLSVGVIAHKREKDGRRYIQTDAAISPGSSGGGLFDRDGNLIGITTSGHTSKDAENINYAIPADLVFGYDLDTPPEGR